MERTFQDAITSIDYSENMIVMRTMPGMAQSVAYNIDYVRWPEVLVAGVDGGNGLGAGFELGETQLVQPGVELLARIGGLGRGSETRAQA